MDKLIENDLICKLYSIYGDLLTERQRQTVEDYYISNLSLLEIANNDGMSKQAVKFNLDGAIKNMIKYESGLKHLKKIAEYEKLKKEHTFSKEILDKLDNIIY